MLSFPNAKINIGLNVTARRADGFHTIQSVFVPVALCDALELVESPDAANLVEFTSSGIAIPGDVESNLCCKAYHLMAKDYTLPSVKIHLHKHIPIGAGLGGGSADAAFLIRLINDKFNLNVSLEKMEHYAQQLGSDCAFFIRNQTAYVEGTGTVLSSFSLVLQNYYIALINPNIHINTGKAYSRITPKTPPVSLDTLLEKMPIADWKTCIHNDFEDVVFEEFPAVQTIKETLYEMGAMYASMSGSGSTVYGVFKNKTNLQHVFADYFVWEGKCL
jgi:4-diphosphocytidyl-2-C-methyl-D-erythritol kinase